ncbi:hypothetical protein [Streptomyces sp. NPDC051129]|uniref:hypothetical protein n=1 Tax=Streptomyces sp. NPDC051129 TaxID=3154639 RepID=UPI003423B669
MTLVHLRTGLTHAALGVIYEVGSPIIGRAISGIRPLPTARGFAVPDRPGIRLRTLEDVFAYADAEGVTLRIDGMETQARRPKAGRPGRRAFISGKRKQNTIKTTTMSDHQGRTLCAGAERPAACTTRQPCGPRASRSISASTHRSKPRSTRAIGGLANEFPGQISAPSRKPKDVDSAPLTE